MTQMQPSSPSQRRPRVSFLAQRVFAWFLLAGMGNLGVLAVVFVLAQPTFAIPWQESVAAISSFTQQLYSPTLLFFTAILGIIASLYPGVRTRGIDGEDEAEHAERLIARAVQFSLTSVLSFATIVLLDDPAQSAYVLFAALLSFIAFALAERVAPPPKVSPAERYRRAQAAVDRSSTWAAEALGAHWRGQENRGAWWIISALLIVPLAIPFLIVSPIIWAVWGASTDSAPAIIGTLFVSMLGTLPLVFSWLSSADKADPPRSRLWRSIFLHTLSLAMIGILSLVYFVNGPNVWWIGLGVLASGAIALLLLHLSRPGSLRRARLRVQRRFTEPRIRRLEAIRDDAKDAWAASLLPERRTPLRLIRRLIQRRC